MTRETVLREFRCTSEAEWLESSGFYNHERMADEIVQLRAQLAGVREALLVYHHAFVTDNKPPVAAQIVARDWARQHCAILGGAP